MTVLVEVDSLTDYPPIPSIETGKRRTVAHVFCPVVKRRHVNDPNGWPVDHLVAKARKARDPIVDNQPRCCANTSSVTVPVRIPVEEAQDSTTPLAKAMKHVQDGPSIYTKEWNEVHGRRNSVESVNGTLKGSLGAFIDDPRTRLMRVWALQFFLTAFAVAGTNHRLIVSGAKDDVLTVARTRSAPSHRSDVGSSRSMTRTTIQTSTSTRTDAPGDQTVFPA